MPKPPYINWPFAVFLPDDLIVSEIPCIKQLIDTHKEHKCNVVAVQEVDENNIVWSEKYRSILFISNAHNNSDIYQMKPDGSSQEIILNSKDSFASLDW